MPGVGSPPRVRGKEFPSGFIGSYCRITPACAGKSMHTLLSTATVRDHPRVCGEKFTGCFMRSVPLGSPPRVRGKAFVQSGFGGGTRITPACAGKRSAIFAESTPAGDHPRVCGEKTALALPVLAPMGSPPRVRGKVPSPPRCFRRTRIAPACAGKRSAVSTVYVTA